eukprot:CAMPEP_0171934878 /NCGR_PEP_ID=MMETSP0993-20121228/32406_1 /TAXON_ID=483369 /ORGANISM="non described non described, Strain CCMP2098" /LENGTH=113 /DNA_ID=CAMNT_0012575687 /DNA_START=68 /DNA_END=409 /DNA_ORIENTATION=+
MITEIDAPKRSISSSVSPFSTIPVVGEVPALVSVPPPPPSVSREDVWVGNGGIDRTGLVVGMGDNVGIPDGCGDIVGTGLGRCRTTETMEVTSTVAPTSAFTLFVKSGDARKS